MEELRDTKFAEEMARAVLRNKDGVQEARIERLRLKESGEVEIRFSWWKDGKMMPRALKMPEDDIAELLKRGFAEKVLTEALRLKLRQL